MAKKKTTVDELDEVFSEELTEKETTAPSASDLSDSTSTDVSAPTSEADSAAGGDDLGKPDVSTQEDASATSAEASSSEEKAEQDDAVAQLEWCDNIASATLNDGAIYTRTAKDYEEYVAIKEAFQCAIDSGAALICTLQNLGFACQNLGLGESVQTESPADGMPAQCAESQCPGPTKPGPARIISSRFDGIEGRAAQRAAITKDWDRRFKPGLNDADDKSEFDKAYKEYSKAFREASWNSGADMQVLSTALRRIQIDYPEIQVGTYIDSCYHDIPRDEEPITPVQSSKKDLPGQQKIDFEGAKVKDDGAQAEPASECVTISGDAAEALLDDPTKVEDSTTGEQAEESPVLKALADVEEHARLAGLTKEELENYLIDEDFYQVEEPEAKLQALAQVNSDLAATILETKKICADADPETFLGATVQTAVDQNSPMLARCVALAINLNVPDETFKDWVMTPVEGNTFYCAGNVERVLGILFSYVKEKSNEPKPKGKGSKKK